MYKSKSHSESGKWKGKRIECRTVRVEAGVTVRGEEERKVEVKAGTKAESKVIATVRVEVETKVKTIA